MYNNVNYLTKKANFKQVNPSIPITQEIPDAEDPATFEASKRRLVEDLLKTAKQMEYLIDALPADKDLDKQSKTENAESNGVPGQVHLDVDSDPELLALEAEMQQVNQEYLLVLKEAEEAQEQLQSTMRAMLDEHHQLSGGLLL